VLGAPVAHSLSPVLHRAAYRALGLADWSYQAIECDESGLPGLLAGLGPDWAGLSLTMPLKRAVTALLDWAEPLVRETGAANTVVFRDRARHGFNTDVPGMVTALAEAGVAAGDQALVLGGGATACTALAALRELGQPEAAVAVRDPARAEPLLAAAERLSVRVRLVTFGAEGEPGTGASAGRPLVIATVPAGAADIYAERISARTLVPSAALDVVYHPWPTRLATAAGQAGARVIDGFELLLHQAAEQVRLMTGMAAPVAEMRAAGRAELRRRNMSGSHVTGGPTGIPIPG
jgi:shikimate dehydrogenase